MNMDFDFTPEKLELTDGDQQYSLHPIWVRERSQEEDSVDQNNYQRLYDLNAYSMTFDFRILS